jgi:hypothetical protein
MLSYSSEVGMLRGVPRIKLREEHGREGIITSEWEAGHSELWTSELWTVCAMKQRGPWALRAASSARILAIGILKSHGLPSVSLRGRQGHLL